MSDNRFSDYETAETVLWEFASRYSRDSYAGIRESSADALARIAELSPRTVDAAGRERVREIVSGWVDGMQCHAVTDRIIDALGWTAAEPDPDADLKLKPGEVSLESKLLRRDLVVDDPAPVPPAPVVELDARAKVTDLNVDDLETLRDRLGEWPDSASGLGISERHPIATDIGWIVHNGREWVLRIGGDQ